ncbi:hypothetical protein U879_11825 [Defluviimonas sp. 20V17]|uniref:Flagellin-specific chaperone FliS n=1 Tax=Allgaiera indica TaxID=765699 RepID=A0AAN4UN02_9RHOB|nr:flagellar protein FliS [Allgaiera indica]KDB03500.1 hypothetical protein U879_11825 [Defluviimonas sp. 20V17]GHD98094.1 hypothetical protein GCM10008024_00230 [Allgaiera indica]SDW54055.1 Flagellin-specific chaperone FliS [Allgaiera indica]
MSDTAAFYRDTAVLSEEPTLETLLIGLRGVRTYLTRTRRAIELEQTEAKIAAVTGASGLLSFLQAITVPDGPSSLGGVLAGLYTSYNVRLTQAHAENDTEALRAIVEQIGMLETEIRNLAER